MILRFALFAFVLCMVPAVAGAQIQAITFGDGIDYQPAVLRASSDGARIVVFERLDVVFSGDLWLTRSSNGGQTWSTPVAIIASAASERHPALIEASPGNFTLFYLKGTGSNSSYRLWRATSSDGVSFSEQGVLDLGWSTGGEINPHVIRHADGLLTMTYQRLSGGVYIAQSTDGGATWDTQKTVLNASGQLPRIAFRESDGLYLASYQTGNYPLLLWVKTSTDAFDWSAPAQSFASPDSNHDSLPVVMPDGAFVLFWVRGLGGPFNIVARRSSDGLDWSGDIEVTTSGNHNDVEPHPLVGTSPGVVELYWGRESPLGSSDFNIVRKASVVVLDAVYTDGFE